MIAIIVIIAILAILAIIAITGERPSGAVPFKQVPMPRPARRTLLNKIWVQYEACMIFLGRGMGMNITAHIGNVHEVTSPSIGSAR